MAFEFRFKACPEKRHIWAVAFIGGSLLATFSQGVVMGTYIAGIATLLALGVVAGALRLLMHAAGMSTH
ncbi:cytochrome d ubiquinol oxidase subunit II [Pseudomonas sp. ANT_J28]|nr:cytochrome d ubiquinol oxidase subunit II [Pseudomonas sp. ANT_J28]